MCLSSPAFATLVGSAPVRAEIHEHRDDDDDEVDPGDGAVRVHRPGVGDGGERHEEESEDRPQVRIVGAADVVAAEEHDEEHEAGEGKRETPYETSHGGRG